MDKQALIKNINIASKRRQADLVIKNCRIVNVFTHEIEEGDIAINGSSIVGVGRYSGLTEIDAGGIILANQGEILERLELPVAGLMSTLTVEENAESFERIRNCAVNILGVSSKIDPILTLCFMSLPVIPEIKLTDMGIFSVSRQQFIPLEA